MKSKYLWLIPVLSIFSVNAYSEIHSHCMQKTFSEYGNTETCIKNSSLSSEHFKQVCEPNLGDEVQVQSHYISSCPANYKGVCKGLKTQSGVPIPYVSYLYVNDIAFMKQSCLSNGGSWEDGDA